MSLTNDSQVRQCVFGFLQLTLACAAIVSVAAEPYQNYLDYLLDNWFAAFLGVVGATVLFIPTLAIAAGAMTIAVDSTMRVTVQGIRIRLGSVMLLLCSLGSIVISILALRNAASSGQPGLAVSTTWDLNNIAIHSTLVSPMGLGVLAIVYLAMTHKRIKGMPGQCDHCGYPLTPGQVCSECGKLPKLS